MSELVVGIDGSDNARAALSWAVDEARLRDDDLTVVTVVPPAGLLISQVGIEDEYLERAEQAALRRARLLLDDAVAPHADGGVAITTEMVRDAPAFQALIDRAVDADALVVGSRGGGAPERLLLGSVSQQLAVHAQGTLVVVPPRGPDPQRREKVIVGVDGSQGARAALRRAADEASARQCELELIMAQPAPPVAGDRPPAQAAVEAYVWTGAMPPSSMDPGITVQQHREQIVAHWRQTNEARLERELTHVDRALLPDKVTLSVIGASSAAKALLDAAEWATLLVVGRRGRGGFAGMLLGSVSQHCVRHASAPIMVVPHDGA